MSLVSAVLSLVFVAGFSDMNLLGLGEHFYPGPAFLANRHYVMTGAGIVSAMWVSAALWARNRRRLGTAMGVPRWLMALLVVLSGLYSFAIIMSLFA